MKDNNRRYFQLPDKKSGPMYVNTVESINYNWLIYETTK